MRTRKTTLDISLFTSLFRAEPYLDAYTRHVLDVAARLKAAGLALDVILVANDASDRERQAVERLIAVADAAQTAAIRAIYVPRETVYASWNRGVRAAAGQCVGPWNVDDIRTADALIEGCRLIAGGCAAVYFPFDAVISRRVVGGLTFKQRVSYPALPYEPELFRTAMRGASFFLFARDLYNRVGPFDEHFHIAGDFEWCIRATDVADFCPGAQIAGTFHLHGSNLSDTGNPRQQVENNIVHLRRGAWERVTPADPDLMRACWTGWGDPGHELPERIQHLLWGAGARERWQTWLRDRRRARRRVQISELLRAGPRFIINRTGLRPVLARFGVVNSAAVER